ncbi:MAG TPA: phosphoglucosamine mutase [Gaiellaceae bacterium]|nr:phosphoglucosamine mutase [Gaiellaceae bacterium]
MARRFFGTDGVRGVVGEELTPDLVERIGRAATLWVGGGRVLVGRDTRATGPELEASVARGIASAGGTALLGGVLPTPAVALLAEGLGVVVSASHNPPEYNGVKLFRDGGKLVDEQEVEIEGLLDAVGSGSGSTEHVDDAAERYLEHVLAHFGSDLTGLRVGVDCANGAYAEIAPRAFEQLGAEVHAVGVEPDGSNINVGCGATDLTRLRQLVTSNSLDLGVAFDGDGDRVLAVDERGEPVDGDQIVAVLALHLGVEVVAVTVMTNLGFHRLMAERGVRVVTTPVGDRYVLEALKGEGAQLGGEQSGHVIWLRDHVTGDGLAAALLLCGAIRGGTLSEAAGVMPRFPQVLRNVRVSARELPQPVVDEVDRVNAELGESGRVLVRRSGTEPLFRVLVEAENAADAEKLCASIAALVQAELG